MYMRYCQQQKPIVARQNPEINTMEVVKKIAEQWRMMSPEQKQPYKDAFVEASKQYKVDFERYRAQLSPAQLVQQALERKQRLDKNRAVRKKRELNTLGKPKRPRTAFNIFMSEHFVETGGASTPGRMRSLMEDWKNMFSHQKQVYIQLAEDDKIRYKNEIESWEEHMIEIGREDVLRGKTISARKKAAAQSAPAKKATKKATKKKTKKVKVKKAAGGAKSKTTKKTSKSTSAKTASQTSTEKS